MSIILNPSSAHEVFATMLIFRLHDAPAFALPAGAQKIRR
jgi:hypothetical protein